MPRFIVINAAFIVTTVIFFTTFVSFGYAMFQAHKGKYHTNSKLVFRVTLMAFVIFFIVYLIIISGVSRYPF